jgi:16S rRNA U1498 N3-methylase RsmE
MNLLLIHPHEPGPAGRVRLTGRRAWHLVEVLRVEPGRTLRAGVVGRGIGRARVVALAGPADPIDPADPAAPGEPDRPAVDVILEGIGTEPDRIAEGPPVDLVLAVPRPKALRRILRLVAALGVRRLTLVNAWRVEKSYFSSPVLEPEAIDRELLLGAEQGGTARLPEVAIERLFVPFVERLEAQEPTGPRLVAHPDPEARPLSTVLRGPAGGAAGAGRPDGPGGPGKSGGSGAGADRTPVLLAIGPEGGWIPDELGSFDRAGFTAIRLGPWLLPTEAAVTAALAQLHLRASRA